MSTHNTASLQGLRVLVVEDEAMVSMLLEDILQELGCHLVGPAFNLQQALSVAASDGDIGAAILDVNLHGTPIYPVADMLAERGVPFVFATGYGSEGVDAKWRARPKLQKPFTSEQVASALTEAITPDPPRPTAASL
ncbi:MAG: response regulator [Methylobacteriaceae bacterium]|nr:response regulator [Methylobacteriaceae bacterium]